MLEKYTRIDDGQIVWFSLTAEVIPALRAVGYRAIETQGLRIVAAPKRGACDCVPDADCYCDDAYGAADAYSDFCSRVSPCDNELTDDSVVEFLDYVPAVDRYSFEASRELHAALSQVC